MSGTSGVTTGLTSGPASGFPEYLPAAQRAFAMAYGRLVQVAERFGYTQLETSAVERVETLTSKGVIDKEVYGLRRLKAEEGDDSKDVALHFDLTVPLARYVAQNQHHLVFPFRRWQSQPVWRGERAKTGRYRQFYQFDVDYIANGALPGAAEAEILAMAHAGLTALGVGPFELRVNDRRLLGGLLVWAGFETPEAQLAALKVVDDWEKISRAEAKAKLAAIVADAKVDELVAVLEAPAPLSALGQLDLPEQGRAGLAAVTQTLDLAAALVGELGSGKIRLDVTIARGLDYYTGLVVETKLLEAPELGSVCSGGRYDNLTEALGGRELPGVGISFGLSRLMVHLLEKDEYSGLVATPAMMGVTCMDEALLLEYAKIANMLRAEGVCTEQVLGGAALGTQLKNLGKRGVAWAVIANADELKQGLVQLKDLRSGVQEGVLVADLAATVLQNQRILADN